MAETTDLGFGTSVIILIVSPVPSSYGWWLLVETPGDETAGRQEGVPLRRRAAPRSWPSAAY